MKKLLLGLIVFFGASLTFAYTDQFHSDQLIVDQYMSPFTGTALNLSLFHTYTYLDDKLLPSSVNKINVFWSVGRLVKLYVEDTLSNLLMVDQHEIFGHGYRLREFGMSDVSYFIGIKFGSVPSGYGWTSFNGEEYDALPFPKQAAISAAGIEANAVFSERIRTSWILDQKIDRREALLYYITSMDQSDYIFLTDQNDEISEGNDVYSYVMEVNSWYGKDYLSTHKLHKYALWDLWDPSLWMGLYAIGDYILQGSPNSPLHMLNIFGYKYILSPRLLLAPYGPEYQLQNYIRTPNASVWQVNVSYGHNNQFRTYGLGIFMRPIWEYQEWKFGNKFYLWRQPQFLKAISAAEVRGAIGGGDFISAEYHLYKYIFTYAELGYKTAGYIQGYPLGNSIVWRMGFSLNY